ncbi:hypothetical protein [[Eubacterium] cellulosolvens]
MLPEIKYKGKDIILTGHIKNELYDIYKKNLDLIFEILSSGTSSKQSKEKTKVQLKTKKGHWELVYVETEDEIILIHLKLRR